MKEAETVTHCNHLTLIERLNTSILYRFVHQGPSTHSTKHREKRKRSYSLKNARKPSLTRLVQDQQVIMLPQRFPQRKTDTRCLR